MQFLPRYTPEIELPPLKEASAVLKNCFIEDAAYAAPFSFMVSVLVGVERMPSSPRKNDLMQDIGWALFGFGNGNDVLGVRYMIAAGEAAKSLYGEKMWDLTLAWSGIGGDKNSWGG